MMRLWNSDWQRRASGLIVVIILMAMGVTDIEAGSSIRLNQPLLDYEVLYDHFISPSGDRVICSLKSGVYSVPVYGGEPVLLSDGMTTYPYGTIVSPDGNHVVFEVKIHNMGNSEVDLYSVPIDGGIPVKITPEIEPRREVKDVTIVSSSIGDRVIWISNIEAQDVYGIYSAPLSGGDVVQLNAPLLDSEEINPAHQSNTYFTPDGNHLLYSTKVLSLPLLGMRLYHVDLLDYHANRFYQDIDIIDSIYYDVKISNDSNWVLISALNDNQYTNELFSFNLNNGSVNQLSMPDHRGYKGWFAEDSQTVIYQNRNYSSEEVYNLYSVPITGGTPTLLNESGRIQGLVKDSNLLTTENGSTVVYALTRSQSDRFFHLYSVDINGGDRVRLNPTIGSDSDFGDYGHFCIHPGQDTVIFTNRSLPNSSKMYRVGIHGGPVIDVIPTVDGDWQDTRIHSLTPDMDFVLFEKSKEEGGVEHFQLFAVPVFGGEAVKVGDPSENGVTFVSAQTTADGKTVVYKTKTGQSYPYEYNLYSVGFPLTMVDTGISVMGDVGGVVGAPGRVDFGFESVVDGDVFSSVFYRLTAAERVEKSLGEINFLMPGDTLQLWDMGFAGDFDGPVTLILTYDESLLDEPCLEGALEIYHQADTGTWELLPILARDITANTITVQSDSFSNFALGVPEPAGVSLLVIGSLALTRRRQTA